MIKQESVGACVVYLYNKYNLLTGHGAHLFCISLYQTAEQQGLS